MAGRSGSARISTGLRPTHLTKPSFLLLTRKPSGQERRYLNIPEELPNELFEHIICNSSFKLERIISKGHSTTEGQWFNQTKDEWVILLKGSAGIAIEGEEGTVVLKPGDYMHLPAHLKHRVEWTDPATATVWLALHYEQE